MNDLLNFFRGGWVAGFYELPLRRRVMRSIRRRLGLHSDHLYHWSDVKASMSGGPRAACYVCGKRS